MRGMSDDRVVLPPPAGPPSATSSPGSTRAETPRSTLRAGVLASLPWPSAAGVATAGASSRVGRIGSVGDANHTSSISPSPRTSTRSTAPGRSVSGTGASSTSNTRSNETKALRRSPGALLSAASRPDRAQCDEEGAAEQRRLDPRGPHAVRPRREAALLVAATTEQLDQQGAG